MTTQSTQRGWYIAPEYPCHVQIEKSGTDGRTWGCVVANCDSSDFLTDEEKRVNAQLVSAAPDLLEALENLLSDEGAVVGDGWDNPFVAEARAAIAKAGGNVTLEEVASDKTRRIAELNDLCRTAEAMIILGQLGGLVQTAGINALLEEDRSAIRKKVEQFNDFTEDNDPDGERACGAFEHNGQKIIFKIDYYDPTLTEASENPADPGQTARVLTIMLATEY